MCVFQQCYDLVPQPGFQDDAVSRAPVWPCGYDLVHGHTRGLCKHMDPGLILLQPSTSLSESRGENVDTVPTPPTSAFLLFFFFFSLLFFLFSFGVCVGRGVVGV